PRNPSSAGICRSITPRMERMKLCCTVQVNPSAGCSEFSHLECFTQRSRCHKLSIWGSSDNLNLRILTLTGSSTAPSDTLHPVSSKQFLQARVYKPLETFGRRRLRYPRHY